MIPAIVAPPVAPPAAGGASSASSDGAAGLAFGNAVKDVGRDRAERDGKGQEKPSDAKTSGADSGPKSEHKRVRAGADDKEAAAKDDANVSAADILGKLFGVANPQEIKLDEKGNRQKADDQDGEGDLQEHLIISTVMDLAGEAEAKAATKGQVSLRVLKMETHFEPRIDGATLVDPKEGAESLLDLTAVKAGATTKDGAEAGKTLRKGFDEILQGLGRPTGEAGQEAADGNGEAGQDRREQNRTAAAKADKSAAADAARALSSAKAGESHKEPTSTTTGQLISSQVAGRIVEAFSSERAAVATQSETPNTPNAQLLRMTAGGAAMKTLSIQLQPQDLGRLDVSMKLIGGRLSVELAASEPSTAQALAGDRHTLRKLLEHAGFALDDAAITIVARDVGPISQSSSSGNAPGDGQGGASSRGQERSFEGNGAGGQGSASGERRRDPRPEEAIDRQPPRGAGNIFL